MSFKELKKHKKGGRSGELKTRVRAVKTPFFMPVATKGAVKGLQPFQVADTGAQVLLSNTYHLHIQPGEKVVKKLGGLHCFSQWKGPILTDSGGFQVFSLSKIRRVTEEGVHFKNPQNGNSVFISPEKSIQIQFDLGSDIIMALDDVPGLSVVDRERAPEALERTHRWLERCVKEFQRLAKNKQKRPLLFGIQQGGLSKELRKKSLDFVQSQPVDGVAIGGLSVGETRVEMYEMLRFLSPMYDPRRPRYLMGVGEPVDMRFAIEHGIDMFDCVLPTRNGRHATAWISGDKKIHLTNTRHTTDNGLIDDSCDCQTCTQGYSRGFLRHQFKVNESLAGSLVSIHNLRYLARITEEYRNGL